MIEKLTELQEKQLVEFRESILDKRNLVRPINKEKIPGIINYIYKIYLNIDSPEIVYCDSPMQAQLLINIIKSNLSEDKKMELRNDIHNVTSKSLKELIGKLEYFGTELYGISEAYWVAFYMFPKLYMGIDYGEYNEGIEMMYEYINNCGIIYTFDTTCFVCENPIEVNKVGTQLHADGKPSITYKDGYSIYTLNGVNVPEWIAMTPVEQLNPKDISKIDNADVRTEFIRKVGIDRFVDIGELVDSYENYEDKMWKQSEYKLLDMSKLFTSIKYAPFLYMLNQTVAGVYHLEAVSPNCKTIKEALDERYSIDISKYNIIDIK